MAGERRHLHLSGAEDPIWRLWSRLPEAWRGPIIGDDVEGWELISENDDYRINLTGLPKLIQAELAWMAHWQASDGTRSSVLAISQLANILRRAIKEDHPFPPSIRQMDWESAAALQRWFYATRWGRFPPRGVRARLRVIFRFAHTALIAACHDGHWWELDYWHPRCDQRIPLSDREPQAHYGCSPALITHPWLREAIKWYLGTMLESGALRWTTVSQERLRCLHRFDRWLAVAFDDPREVLADPAAAPSQAAAFRRWDADPANNKAGERIPRFVVHFMEVPPGSLFRSGIVAWSSFALVWLVGFTISKGGNPGTDAPAILLAFPAIAAAWLGFEAPSQRLLEGTLGARISLICSAFCALAASGFYVLHSAMVFPALDGSAPFPVNVTFIGISETSWGILAALAVANALYVTYFCLLRTWKFKYLSSRYSPETSPVVEEG